MPSMATSLLTFVRALQTGNEKYWGGSAQYAFENAAQGTLVNYVKSTNPDEIRDRLQELKSLATTSADAVNDFFRKNGFDLQVQDGKKGDLYLAALIDVLVRWLQPGKPVDIENGRLWYRGVELETGVYFRTIKNAGTVATIQTPTGDAVHLMMYAGGFIDEMHLATTANSLYERWRAEPNDRQYDGVQFPMIHLEQTGALPWLMGLTVRANEGRAAGEWSVEQAKQQVQLRMNLEGARAKAAVVMTMRAFSASLPKPPLLIDQPFLVWFTRPGVTLPYFTAWCDVDCWKDPGSLS